jgi:hypothetical protein
MLSGLSEPQGEIPAGRRVELRLGFGFVSYSRRRGVDEAADYCRIDVLNRFGFVSHLTGFQQFGVCFVVAALGGRGEALENAQGAVGAGEESGGDGLVGVSGGHVFAEHLIERRGLEPADAAEAPAGVGHLFDQERLVLVGGLELVAEAGEEDVEFFLVLMAEDLVGGGQAGFGERGGTDSTINVSGEGGKTFWRGGRFWG